MSAKLLWTGLTFIVALPSFLSVFGLSVNEEIIVLVGAILMGIGLFLLWQDK